ncbi:hypothetical protein ERJ75_000039100 [Trypanosoma vivax]|uniref:Uncharacterized protein n=1 Tax=Trypanosoma vivax (strain Y486) TaxID=1055687 RepID=G0U7K1_TRYVY|nr:hypothetical protein TRVL_01454 [Trypanosoma vivax]KAH8620515.1 hypothetical protein ERJ75_000039100 [Trypanosoma vivax]CCC51859.1 conserved hypothetical protein [Trypanosoma vivax Y486]
MVPVEKAESCAEYKICALENAQQSSGAVELLRTLTEASRHQPQRPIHELFRAPAWPTWGTYKTLILVNMLWFSRNYYNIAFVISLMLSFVSPPIILLLIAGASTFIEGANTKSSQPSAGKPGDDTRSTGTSQGGFMRLLTFIRLLLFVEACYLCGFLSFIVHTLLIAGPIFLHALVTPYTDEAYDLYYKMLHDHNLLVPLPCSPTRQFSCVDPSFERAGRSRISSLVLDEFLHGGRHANGLHRGASQFSPLMRQQVTKDGRRSGRARSLDSGVRLAARSRDRRRADETLSTGVEKLRLRRYPFPSPRRKRDGT